MFRKLLIFFISSILFLSLAPVVLASTLHLSPGKVSVAQGGTVSVQVRLNTAGESINGVSAYLSYPTNLLEVAWVSAGSSAFGIDAEKSFGGGGIRISRGSISGTVGNVNVATIGFRGKALGTANVSFIGGSAATRTSDSSDSLNLGGSSGASVAVVKGTPGTQIDKTKPEITDIKVSDISTNSAAISWTTDKDSDSTVELGFQKDKYILSLYDKKQTKEHKIVITEDLIPGETFHFRVKSKGQFDESVSDNMTFKLKGYALMVKLVDSQGAPLANTQVTLYTDPITSTTNASGEVTFTDVSPGKHLLVVKHENNTETTKEVVVEESNVPTQVTLTIDSPVSGIDLPSSTIYILLALVVAFLGLLLLILRIRRRKSNLPPQPLSPTNTTPNTTNPTIPPTSSFSHP